MYTLCRFLKRLLAACEDIAEGLRVAVHNWKEGGLYMNHNAVALAEAMADIRQGEHRVKKHGVRWLYAYPNLLGCNSKSVGL